MLAIHWWCWLSSKTSLIINISLRMILSWQSLSLWMLPKHWRNLVCSFWADGALSWFSQLLVFWQGQPCWKWCLKLWRDLSIYISYYLYVFHKIWFYNLWRLGCYYVCVIMVTFCCVACYMQRCVGVYAVSNNSWMGDVVWIGHLTTTEEVETM